MKKDWKYIVYLSGAVLLYLTFKMMSPRDIDWTITYHHGDKNPFGTYALDKLIEPVFRGSKINKSYNTLYELLDTVKHPVNFLSTSTSFALGEEDTNALLKNIEQGGTAFIAAQYFSGKLADTLSLYTSDYFFDSGVNLSFNRNDSSRLSFTNPSLEQENSYIFPRKNTHNYFREMDSTRTRIIATNDLGLPVSIKVKWGKGFLFLNSTPLIFTNVYLLSGDNPKFIEQSLSHLPNRDIYWTEFYHLGRMEASTPLRFILTNEPLRWAYYIAILSLLLFILFEAKRRQRIIPLIKPMGNTSLEFVRTIGNLYYQSGDHKNLAEKRIAFLIEQLRAKHNINAHHVNDELLHVISKKTGNSFDDVQTLFIDIAKTQSKPSIALEELKNLNKKLDRFKY